MIFRSSSSAHVGRSRRTVNRYPGETGRPAILDRLDFEEASHGTAGNYAIFKSEF